MRLYAGVATLLVALLLTHSAAAQEPRASKSTYLKLMQVQELWEEENWTQAITDLEALGAKVRGTPYEYALVNQYLAHTSLLAGQTQRARTALEAALSMTGLPPTLVAELKLFYGQVMRGEEEYELARQMFDDWLATTEKEPTPTHLFSAAYAHYRTDSLVRAEELVARAIAEATKPDDNWDRLYYQVLFERGKYDEAEEILMRMVTRDPTDQLRWNMLSNHYLRLEDSPRALAAMLLTYQQNLVDDPSDLRKMVSLYSFVEVPERAARMLEQWMREGEIETEPQTLRQLGDLWMLARERSKAKVVLEQAAAVAEDGRTWEMLGGIHFEDENWAEAYQAFSNALRVGGLKEPHRIQLLAGLSAYRAGMEDEARTALEQAAQNDKLRAQAKGLLKRLDDV
jgi:tetratricopeptide (TPR) repeat protein